MMSHMIYVDICYDVMSRLVAVRARQLSASCISCCAAQEVSLD